MSYTLGTNYITIPTNKSAEKLEEYVNEKLYILTDYILERDEFELKKLDEGEDLLDRFYDEVEDGERDEIFQCLKSTITIYNNEIKISTTSEDGNYQCYYPVISILFHLMNTEWVIHYSICDDSREGMSCYVTLLTKKGEFLHIKDKVLNLQHTSADVLV